MDAAAILRELLDESRDALLVLDGDGTIEYANEAAAALLRRTRSSVSSKPLARFVGPRDHERLGHALAAACTSGSASVSLHLEGAGDAVDAVLRRIGRATPPTVAVALRPDDVSRELDLFFLRFPQAVVGIERTMRVAFANPQAKRLLGRDALRRGRAFRDGPAEGRLTAIAERLVTTAVPVPATLVQLAGDDVLRVTGVPAGGGEPALLLIEDVTEETRSARVTHDFVRNAAHQLRTPLTAIASAIQVLQSGAKEAPADRDRFLAHIERNAERLTRVARGLLALARAQSGEPLRLDFVELRPLLDELVAQATPADGVAIEVACPRGLAAFCEPDLAHEALAAVLDNAVEHTREGSISITARESDGRVAIEIADTGPGILPEHRPRLFEPFYRPTPEGEGFGLGLAIVAQAVNAMDGELVVGDPDRGASFTIRLPSARIVR